MRHTSYSDERLFRSACAVLLLMALLCVLAVTYGVLQLAAEKKSLEHTPDLSGFLTPAPDLF
ncbi:MAG: hypothetical protein K8I82_29385, partial [Anaerolineae bacterium]|nr:hypothetical protein [Anaerolineae bacterium]